jgi:hypothetical protein
MAEPMDIEIPTESTGAEVRAAPQKIGYQIVGRQSFPDPIDGSFA